MAAIDQASSGPTTGDQDLSGSESDSGSSQYEALDVTRDDGWEDVESDNEAEPVVSLFTDKVFPDVQSMLLDCKDNHGFDFLRVQKELGV
jgi:protein arginine N-methyltransferase 3